MKDFLYRELWVPILVNNLRKECLTLDNDVPEFALGEEVMLRLALYDRFGTFSAGDYGEFRNHARVSAFVLKLFNDSYGGTVKINSSAGGTLSPIDATVTEEQFAKREKAPINIYLPSAITAPSGIAGVTNYIVFSGTTNESGEPSAFGKCRCDVVDLGLGVSASAPPAGETAATVSFVTAALQNVVKFGKNPAGKYPVFVSPGGKFGRPGVPPDDKGNPIGNLERYP